MKIKVFFCMAYALTEKFQKHLISQFVEKRKELGLTQNALDRKMNVAIGLVSKWEVGIRKPSGYLFCCWAEALECELWLKRKN